MEVYNRTIILIFLYALVAVCLSGVSAAAVINSGVGAIQAAPTLADITTSVFASSDGSAVVSPCDHVCTEGGCVFEYCFGSFSAEGEEEGGVEPRERPAQCPGGACKFKQCSNPTCDGTKKCHINAHFVLYDSFKFLIMLSLFIDHRRFMYIRRLPRSDV